MERTAEKGRKTVLVVDDNADFAAFVKSAAEMRSFRAVTLTDSSRFRDLFETLAPDILVLDMVMPGIEGTEIVDWLAERKAPVKVIIVSGFNPLYSKIARTLAEAKGLGAVTTLRKPVRLAEMLAALGEGE
ncbi:MAG: response regulator [Pseudomonadota bacterium]